MFEQALLDDVITLCTVLQRFLHDLKCTTPTTINEMPCNCSTWVSLHEPTETNGHLHQCELKRHGFSGESSAHMQSLHSSKRLTCTQSTLHMANVVTLNLCARTCGTKFIHAKISGWCINVWLEAVQKGMLLWMGPRSWDAQSVPLQSQRCAWDMIYQWLCSVARTTHFYRWKVSAP